MAFQRNWGVPASSCLSRRGPLVPRRGPLLPSYTYPLPSRNPIPTPARSRPCVRAYMCRMHVWGPSYVHAYVGRHVWMRGCTCVVAAWKAVWESYIGGHVWAYALCMYVGSYVCMYVLSYLYIRVIALLQADVCVGRWYRGNVRVVGWMDGCMLWDEGVGLLMGWFV